MRANRTDANQTEIIKFFEQAGCSVVNISSLKNRCDLVVSKNLITVFVEVKDGSKPPSQRQLTKGEEIFRDTTKGAWFLIESIEDAQRLVEWLNSAQLKARGSW